MKNYRVLVPIVMVVLMGLSWYMMIDEAVEATNVYDGYVQEARKYAEEGITKYAIENYRLALAEESSPELYREVAEYYKEKGTKSAYIDWCEEFYEVYPTDVSAYECLVEAYISDKDYDDCFDVLETAEKRNITSEALEQMKLEIKYIYEIEFSSFDEIASNTSPLIFFALTGSFVPPETNVPNSSKQILSGFFQISPNMTSYPLSVCITNREFISQTSFPVASSSTTDAYTGARSLSSKTLLIMSFISVRSSSVSVRKLPGNGIPTR